MKTIDKIFITSFNKKGMGKEGMLYKRSKIYLVIVTLMLSLFVTNNVAFANITTASNAMSTIRESVLANHTIQFISPGGVGAGQTVTITFPAGFTMGTFALTNFDFSVSSGGTCSGFADITLATTPSGATWGVAQAGQTITFTSATGTVAAGRCLLFRIGANATIGGAGVNQITNQTVTQNNTDSRIVIGGTSGNTTGLIAVEIVADDDATVTATVDPSITCVFTGMTTNFASLNTGVIATSDTTTNVTISTNAGSGFNLTIRGAGNGTNPGLFKSTATTYLIGSADGAFADTATLAAGTDGFGIQGATSGGTGGAVTIAARYLQSGNVVGGLELTDQLLASAASPAANRVVTVTHRAAVSGMVVAGAYADTLTYVCTGIY